MALNNNLCYISCILLGQRLTFHLNSIKMGINVSTSSNFHVFFSAFVGEICRWLFTIICDTCIFLVFYWNSTWHFHLTQAKWVSIVLLFSALCLKALSILFHWHQVKIINYITSPKYAEWIPTTTMTLQGYKTIYH